MDKDYTMYMLKHLIYDQESYKNINSDEIDYFNVDTINVHKCIRLITNA